MMKTIFVGLAFFISSLASASDNLIGKVLYTGTYGDGTFFVAVDVMINEPGCEGTRIDVAPNHPQIDQWLSIALAAHASGKPIQFRTKGCYTGKPTLDNTKETWLHSRFTG